MGGGTADYTLVRMRAHGFSADDVLAVGGVSVAGDAIDGALVRAAVAPHFGAGVKYRVPFGANDLELPQLLIELLASPADLDARRPRAHAQAARRHSCGPHRSAERPKIDRFFTVVDDGVGFTLYDAVERAKRRLSDEDDARIVLDYPDAEIDVRVTRPVLATAAERAIDRMLASLDEVLAMAGARPDDVEIVCLTGGTSRMPLVEAAFRRKLPGAELRRLSSFHSVVQGLARHARAMA
ncbi:MAG: Hsp70 family protein [Polyangiaceae bacterium]